MKEINNLTYTLEINFVNKSGLNTSISLKFHDDGLKVKSVKVGNVCITEETINGRVLSGRLDNSENYYGYRYNYKNGESLININPNMAIDSAIYLINKYKREKDFLAAELVLSSIVRNDYRVITLDEGNLSVTKTVSAENERSEHCCLQEIVDLSKLNGEEYFIEKNKKRVCTIDNKLVEESQICELSDVVSKNPQNYKDLIEIKKQIEKECCIC